LHSVIDLESSEGKLHAASVRGHCFLNQLVKWGAKGNFPQFTLWHFSIWQQTPWTAFEEPLVAGVTAAAIWTGLSLRPVRVNCSKSWHRMLTGPSQSPSALRRGSLRSLTVGSGLGLQAVRELRKKSRNREAQERTRKSVEDWGVTKEYGEERQRTGRIGKDQSKREIYLGTQFGGVRSTSQAANNLIGIGCPSLGALTFPVERINLSVILKFFSRKTAV